MLRQLLVAIKKVDAVCEYGVRYQLVYQALAKALEMGFEAGVRLDPAEPEWPVVFIELPNGQVSWHMPQHVKPWDGHTTEEKYRRVAEFAEKFNTGR